MIGIGVRIAKWLWDLSREWGNPLQGWMASWLMKGVQITFDSFEPDIRAEVKPSLQRLTEIPGLPEDIKAILDKAIEEPSFVQFAAILPYLIGIMIGFGMGTARPAMNLGSYQIEKLMHSFRLDPATITRIWLRDKLTHEKLWDDLKDLGWSEERIDVAKELAKIIPPLPDMVRFADFSAFDPEVIAAWREFYDAPDWIADPMSLIGITNEEPRDWANKYWFSHWRQPGRFELGEMYRKGLLGEPKLGGEEIGKPGGEGEAEATIKLAYKTMGYSAFWQDRLLQLVRAIPTRVDVRRWWDMRTIDEEELRSLYQRQGYFGKDLENYILWTKVYVEFPDLVARYKNGWINKETVLSEIIALGMSPARAQTLFETKFKKVATERTAPERDLTATDIIAGVKKGVITWGEGTELLMDLGYDEEEADFKLAVRIETEGGSPENMAEYKRLTQLYRVSQGLPTKMTAAEIKAAEKELAEKYPKRVPLTEEELKVRVDTTRRKRRKRQLTRDEEIATLLELGLTVELATAYADNDDLRLRQTTEGK